MSLKLIVLSGFWITASCRAASLAARGILSAFVNLADGTCRFQRANNAHLAVRIFFEEPVDAAVEHGRNPESQCQYGKAFGASTLIIWLTSLMDRFTSSETARFAVFKNKVRERSIHPARHPASAIFLVTSSRLMSRNVAATFLADENRLSRRCS
jgi:hypothetical protein